MDDLLPVSCMTEGEVVGQLVDITSRGLMVMGSLESRVGSHRWLLIHLPEPINGQARLELDAECVWCRPAPVAERFNAGYRFMNPDPQTIEIIELLNAVPVSAE